MDQNTQPSIDTQIITAWIGIDVSKQTLDACVMTIQGKTHAGVFANDRSGSAKLLKWAKRLIGDARGHFCLESTGAYSSVPALYLAEARELVSVINPFRAKHAALAQGATNKTDQVDARLLAQYCRQYQPHAWRLSAPAVRELVALVRHLDALVIDLAQIKARLKEPGLLAPIQASWQTVAETLTKQIDDIDQQIAKHIKNDPDLKRDRALLLTIPGIGEGAARHILSELPDVSEFSRASQAGAYAGLNPREYRSGTSVHRRTKLSKQGNARLRRALYMPAMTAIRFNPRIRAMAERLTSKGKVPMSIIGAAMRKLLMIAFGVLRTQKAFAA